MKEDGISEKGLLKLRIGKKQKRVLQEMQSAGLVIRTICDFRRNAKPYHVLEDEDNVNTYETLRDDFVAKLVEKEYIIQSEEMRCLDVYVYTCKVNPELKQTLCVHDYGYANYGFQTCTKCGYIY